MALQNIGASNRNDAYYRYKMPKMVTKTEGKGNGIKTNVVNMVEIAKALGRPASYTTKYFGCELGAQSKFDEKTGIALVNGSHDTPKLAGLLENFIKKYVQCYGCSNPETEIVITKSQMLRLKCAACGFLSDVDMRDKLTSFILKNPPEQKKGSKDKKAMRRAEKERLKEGEAADEELKKIKKEAKKKGCTGGAKDKTSKKKSHASDEDSSPPRSHINESEQVSEEDDDDIQWQTDTSREAAEKRIKEQLSAVTADMVMLSTVEEKKPAVKCSSEHPSKVVENGNGKTANPHEILLEKIKENIRNGSSASQLKSVIASSITSAPQDTMDALFSALFEGVGKGFAKEVVKRKQYLAVLTQDEASQVVLLNAIGSFCERARPEAVKEVALILKALYDEDVLEEHVIMNWYQKGLTGDTKSSTVWKNVKPFIEWLENAESETEEE